MNGNLPDWYRPGEVITLGHAPGLPREQALAPHRQRVEALMDKLDHLTPATPEHDEVSRELRRALERSGPDYRTRREREDEARRAANIAERGSK